MPGGRRLDAPPWWRLMNGVGCQQCRAGVIPRIFRLRDTIPRPDNPWGDGLIRRAYFPVSHHGRPSRQACRDRVTYSEFESMPETMIERIARFLWDRERNEPDAPRFGEDGTADPIPAGWQDYTTDAKAILTVMRDPTERMILSIPRDWRRGTAEELWQAMIDASRAGR